MAKVGHLVAVLSCCAGLCFAQGPDVTHPDPNGSTEVTLDEGLAVGYPVLTVVTAAPITSLTVSAVRISDGAVVSGDFRPSSRTVLTTLPLDFETTQVYTVTVTATNGTGSTAVDFTLRVNDVVDETPVLAASNVYSVAWAEEQAAGSQVFGSFAVTDADAGDSQTFYLTGNHAEYFSIDESSGVVTVNTKLDRDAPAAITTFNQLELKVVDKGGNSATQALVVTLTDINDNAPVCSPSWYTATLAENTGGAVSAAQLTCTDIDASPNGDITSYVISSGDDSPAKFTTSGSEVQTTAQPLDYETKNQYQLIVNVIDNGATSQTGSATVDVHVTEVNENTPTWTTFTPPGPIVSQPEDVAVGTTLITVTASDNGEGDVIYLLVSVKDSGGNAVSDIIRVDDTSGKVVTRTLLDYDAGVTSYEFVMKAEDKGTPVKSVTASLTLRLEDVNDNEPAFSPNTYSTSIRETEARTSAWAGHQLTATDADPTSGALLYEVIDGDPLSKFAFSGATGGLLVLANTIDVDAPTEDPRLYTLTVQVSDQGLPGNSAALTDTAIVAITITSNSNDHDPVFGTPTPDASPTIDETATPRTTVATLPVTDNDRDNGVSQTVTFEITGGNTDNDFFIDKNNGVVTTINALDYERTQSYALVIEATDSGGPARTATLTLSITVNNVNEQAPTCAAYSLAASVPEQSAAQPVITVTCTDSDTGDTPRYSIVPAVAGFTIDSVSGVVSTISALDYETKTSHSLTIEVQDTLTTTLTATVSLQVHVLPVNEFDPAFSPLSYTAVLSEDAPAGTSVQTVTATDQDAGGLDGTVRYSIVAGNGKGAFVIDSGTGEITTTSVGLDRETDATYTLTVRASDDTPGAASVRISDATVIVTVTDVNDNAPVCTPNTYKAEVTEPSVVSAVVVTLTITDDDEANNPNTTPTLAVTGGNTGGVFGTSGKNLVLAQVVDFETLDAYTLTITVTDGGTPPLSSTCGVDVSILPFNEFDPVFAVADHSTTLSETTPVGTLVYDALATDADVGLGSSVTYSIISGNTDGDFFCYPDTGIVVVWNQLDYDTQPQSYNLTLEARDEAGRAVTMWLYIQLTDVNDQSPVFRRNVYSVTLDENLPNGTLVKSVTADDSDTGLEGTVTYTAVSGDGMSVFAVDPGTGDVTTDTRFNREKRSNYYLFIEAADGGTPSLSSTTLMTITINDINDNAPVFSPNQFAVSVSEDSRIGTSVTTVSATDADSSASNNQFSYVLTNSRFEVKSGSGLIKTLKKLDRETTPSYVIEVLAPDSGAPTLTGTGTVTILIEDVNDNSPVIVGTYLASVSEDAVTGTIVTTITATDADENDNARLTYVIVSGNTDNDFVISDVSGVIQVQNALDRERTKRYDLVVEVHDNGATTQLTATTTVIVNIIDVNDNDPVWLESSYSFTVSENASAGENVGRVRATDADKDVNAALTYTLVLFTTGNAALFTIDGSKGIITTTDVLDRESTLRYVALARVTDAGNPQRYAEVNVTISVDDVNDNVPVFDQTTYSAIVTENDPVDTDVTIVTVTDDDIGVNDDVTLSIDTSTTAGARANIFFKTLGKDPPTAGKVLLTAARVHLQNVSTNTGMVAVKSVIDRETDTSFTFTLLAVDGGKPALTSSANVTVAVVDVNDNAPVFTQTYYNTAIDYAGKCTKSIVTVTATDADLGVNGNVSYYLQTSDNDPLFQVDAVTGEFSLQSGLTAEVIYFLTVSALDGGTPTQTAATPAVIRVDAMIPNNVVLTFKLGITLETFLAQQSTFLQQLQDIVRGTYFTAVAKLWCAETNTKGLVDVHVYFLSDNSTEAVTGINAAKAYVTEDSARAIFTSDAAGTPGSALSGSEWSPFDVRAVQPYFETQTPWPETGEGIAIITACCVVGLVLLGIVTYLAIRYCRHGRNQYTARKVIVEEKRPRSKNYVEPLSESRREPPVEHPDPEPPKQIMPRTWHPSNWEFFWDGSSQH